MQCRSIGNNSGFLNETLLALGYVIAVIVTLAIVNFLAWWTGGAVELEKSGAFCHWP